MAAEKARIIDDALTDDYMDELACVECNELVSDCRCGDDDDEDLFV